MSSIVSRPRSSRRQASRSSLRWRPVWRQSNVLRLRLEWSHVNLETSHAWVGAEQSKNRKPIALPLNATALEVLRRQLGKHPVRVFTYRGKPLRCANTLGMEKGLEARWDREFPLARYKAHLGLVASPGRDADARAAAAGWLALVGDGRRYAHLAPDHLAKAAGRLGSLLGGYDLATSEKEKGAGPRINPLIFWWAVKGSNLRPTD
jgi:hypothetical protein